MKSISDLLKEQENKFMETESQVIENYSNNMVVELLKKSLNIHWQQTTVLSAQAVHLERWGYKKLAAVIKADAIQEQTHAMINVERLEFFDADYQPLMVSPPTWTRHDMVAMIKYNLDFTVLVAKQQLIRQLRAQRAEHLSSLERLHLVCE